MESLLKYVSRKLPTLREFKGDPSSILSILEKLKNDSLNRKLFKLSESESSGKSKSINKRHSFKIISTRNYYSGTHGIAVVVNGYELAYREFQMNAEY